MLPELIILGIFLLVFLADTFSADGSSKKFLTPFAAVLFLLGTVAIWVVPSCGEAVFGGMYVDDAAGRAMKCILNCGVFICMLQAAKWVESDEMKMRKGEFFELLLVTLFGMYLMISPPLPSLHHRAGVCFTPDCGACGLQQEPLRES